MSIDTSEPQTAEREAPKPNQESRLVSGRGPQYLLPLRHPLQRVRELASGKKSSVLPGPIGLPGIGVWHQYNREPAQYVLQMARRYGDVFRLPMPIGDLVILNHPKHYEITHIAKDQRFSANMPARSEAFFAWLAQAMAVPVRNPRRVVDELIFHRRSQVIPILARRSLALVAGSFVNEFIQKTAKWNDWADTGETVDLQHALAPVMLSGFLRSMYSVELPEEELHQVDQDLRTLLAAAGPYGFAPKQFATPPQKIIPAFRRAMKTTAKFVDDRVASGEDRDDMLGKVLRFTGMDGRPLIRAERIFLLFMILTGGYDTLVAAMSWMFGLLALNPEPAEKLYAEIDALDGKVPDYDDLKKLTWTKACFDEAQRLQGGPVHKTQALVDVEIDGYAFPRGTVFGLGWYSMHLDERWWPNAERYDPSRFTDPAVVAARPRTAFVPFGIGTFTCPGQTLAYANAQLLSAVILQRFRFAVPAGWHPEPYFAGSTPVKDGVPVTITRVG